MLIETNVVAIARPTRLAAVLFPGSLIERASSLTDRTPRGGT
jgi:hypothetical protein